MSAVLLSLLLALVAPAPVCGDGEGEIERRRFLLELDLARIAAGNRPLTPHPLLCALAAERAAAVAATGSGDSDVRMLQSTTRRLYRGGYRPHAWSESSLIGDRRTTPLAQWRQVRPDWVAEAVGGEFEHVGIGLASFEGRPVISVVLAQPKCAVEWRRAAPLQEVARVRAEMLRAVNATRARHDRAPLEADPRLDLAAQRHADDMLRRGFYAHRNPDGRLPAWRVREAGYDRSGHVGENIAKGIYEPAEMVERWMGSSGHRKNILRRDARWLGIGVAVAAGDDVECVEVAWVQLFAG